MLLTVNGRPAGMLNVQTGRIAGLAPATRRKN